VPSASSRKTMRVSFPGVNCRTRVPPGSFPVGRDVHPDASRRERMEDPGVRACRIRDRPAPLRLPSGGCAPRSIPREAGVLQRPAADRGPSAFLRRRGATGPSLPAGQTRRGFGPQACRVPASEENRRPGRIRRYERSAVDDDPAGREILSCVRCRFPRGKATR